MAESAGAVSTVCRQCSTPYAEAARFCARCGADVRADDKAGRQRRGAFAVQSGESLWSVNFMSTLMPMAAGRTLQTFRFVLVMALAVPIVAAVFGFMPFALAAAAVAIPLVFLLYLHDVNQWEEEPLPVLGATMVLGGLLALGFTLLWRNAFGGPFLLSATGGPVSIDVKTLLLVGIAVPLVSMALIQLGPIWLASRPRFDDLFDGLTFGVASGVAFAAVETVVLNSGLVFDGPNRIESPNAAVWITIIVVSGLLKPVIYGAASGIATAAFSGPGPGHRGFSGSYLRGFGEAVLAGVAFQMGLYLTGRFSGTVGVTFGLAWALLVAGAVILRLRFVLHTALLEEALEAATAGEAGYGATHGVAFCGQCKLPLLDEASFCVNCGMSVRATSKMARTANTAPDGTKATSKSFPAPALDGWGTTTAAPPGARSASAIMIGAAIVIVALVGGVFAAINSSTRPTSDTDTKIKIDAGQALAATPSGAQTVSFGDQTGTGGSAASADTTPGPLGTTIVIPDGWDVNGTPTDDFIALTPVSGGALFIMYGFLQNPPGEPAKARLENYVLEVLSKDIQGLQGESDTSGIQGDLVRESIFFQWAGQLASNQGTAEVIGGVDVVELEAGDVAIFDRRVLAGTFAEWQADIELIMGSIAASISPSGQPAKGSITGPKLCPGCSSGRPARPPKKP